MLQEFGDDDSHSCGGELEESLHARAAVDFVEAEEKGAREPSGGLDGRAGRSTGRVGIDGDGAAHATVKLCPTLNGERVPSLDGLRHVHLIAGAARLRRRLLVRAILVTLPAKR